MTAIAEAPDTSEMAAIHSVFRNAFAAAPRLIGSVSDGDVARAGVIGSYYLNVLEFLHVHHGGEDELLFPRLEARVPDPAVIIQVASQHENVHEPMAGSIAAAKEWMASGSAADGTELIVQLVTLEAALIPHLDDEEAIVMPFVEEYITLEEWGQLPGHAMQAFQGDNMFLIIGLIRDQFNEEQRARMQAAMPPPAWGAWQSVGIDAYAGTIAAINA